MSEILYGYGREGEEIIEAESLEDATSRSELEEGSIVWVHDPGRKNPQYAWEPYAPE